MNSMRDTRIFVEATIMDIKKTGWVKLWGMAAVLGLVFCGSGLQAEAAPQPDENKMIVISSNSAPPSSYFEGKEHVGFEVDLWREIAERTGMSVQLETSGFSGMERSGCSAWIP